MPMFVNYYHEWFCCMEYYGINITVLYYKGNTYGQTKDDEH